MLFPAVGKARATLKADDECHLLEQFILLNGQQHLGSHIEDILCEQGEHQTHELASGKDESAFVVILGHLLILAPTRAQP